MKNVLEHLINYIEKEELETIFGDGSNVKVHTFIYSTNTKKFYVDATINATQTDEKLYEYIYPFGLKQLIIDAVKYFGINEEMIISTHLQII